MLIRKPVLKNLLSAALVALLIASGALQASAASGSSLERTRKQIEQLRKKLQENRGRADALERDVAALDAQVRQLNRQIRAGQRDIAQMESDIRSAEAAILDLEKRYGAAAAASNDRARRLYKSGPIDTISSFFTAQSAGDLVRLQFFWEVSAEADTKAMIDANRLKKDLAERKEDLVAVKADVVQRKADLESRRSVVAGAEADRAAALGSVNAEIAAQEKEIRDLEQDAKRITAALRSAGSRSTGAVSRAGFIWPIGGRVTSPYGRRWGRMHTGIDIDGNTGDPIRASKAGTILGVSCGSGYGLCTIVDHGGGVATLYAHLSRKAASGGSVDQGEVIGYVGCTGSCTGDHLHFEVRVNGSPENPMNFLP